MNTLSFSLPIASEIAGEDVLIEKSPRTWIITGPRGVGKTTACQMLANQLNQSGAKIGGILSHAQIQNGLKTGIVLENLETGECSLLGVNQPLPGHQLKVGCWYFNEKIVAWGNECLQSTANCDVIFFDECGFLELIEQKGFTEGMRIFDQQKYQIGIVVVRPELLETAQARWPQAKVIEIQRGEA